MNLADDSFEDDAHYIDSTQKSDSLTHHVKPSYTDLESEADCSTSNSVFYDLSDCLTLFTYFENAMKFISFRSFASLSLNEYAFSECVVYYIIYRLMNCQQIICKPLFRTAITASKVTTCYSSEINIEMVSQFDQCKISLGIERRQQIALFMKCL